MTAAGLRNRRTAAPAGRSSPRRRAASGWTNRRRRLQHLAELLPGRPRPLAAAAARATEQAIRAPHARRGEPGQVEASAEQRAHRPPRTAGGGDEPGHRHAARRRSGGGRLGSVPPRPPMGRPAPLDLGRSRRRPRGGDGRGGPRPPSGIDAITRRRGRRACRPLLLHPAAELTISRSSPRRALPGSGGGNPIRWPAAARVEGPPPGSQDLATTRRDERGRPARPGGAQDGVSQNPRPPRSSAWPGAARAPSRELRGRRAPTGSAPRPTGRPRPSPPAHRDADHTDAAPPAPAFSGPLAVAGFPRKGELRPPPTTPPAFSRRCARV